MFLPNYKELLSTTRDTVDWFALSFRLLYELPFTNDIISKTLLGVKSKANLEQRYYIWHTTEFLGSAPTVSSI